MPVDLTWQDWGKKGTLCRHCKLEGVYDQYFYSLYQHRRQRKVELVRGYDAAGHASSDAGAAAGNTGEAFLEDAPLPRLLQALIGWISSQAVLPPSSSTGTGGAGVADGGASRGLWASLCDEATREHEAMGLLKREMRAARSLWSAHFDLLSQVRMPSAPPIIRRATCSAD